MMRYTDVHIEAIAYEMAPIVVSNAFLENLLAPTYQALNIPTGTISALTGIVERRWWEPNQSMAQAAAHAAAKALEEANVAVDTIGMYLYSGVCRDYIEPATACASANEIGIPANAIVADISNACVGVINGLVQIANAIALGQIKAGVVVACESSRAIMERTIQNLNTHPSHALFNKVLATFTGGSSAAAIVLTHRSISKSPHRLQGVVAFNDVKYNALCRWHFADHQGTEMETDSSAVLKYGVQLARRTYAALNDLLGIDPGGYDAVLCHQVGKVHHDTIIRALEIPEPKVYVTYPFLGNMGTVSLPMTLALARENGFLDNARQLGLFGIGSGLNCMMAGIRWQD